MMTDLINKRNHNEELAKVNENLAYTMEKEANSFVEGQAENCVEKMLLKTYYSFELCIANAKITAMETELTRAQ